MAMRKITTTKESAAMIELLGAGYIHENVQLTHDELRNLQKFYGFNPKKDQNAMERAGSDRNLCRYVAHDGFRIMAVIAKYLEQDEDPVTFVQILMADAGYDVHLDEDLEDSSDE